MATKVKNEAEAALPEGQAEKPRKKSKTKRIVIILFLLLITLGLAGGAAYWWLFLREPGTVTPGEEAKTEAPKEAPAAQPQTQQGEQDNLNATRIERQVDLPRSGGMVLSLPPVTVNLSDPNGRRYLKLGMEVEVNADVSAELKSKSAQIRDAIIMLLAGKSYGDVSSPDGKVLLKAEIAARLNQILGAQRVVRVYLTDFVVQ